MKFSPETQFNIIFYSITIPIVPFLMVLAAIAFIIALIPSLRNWSLDGLENLVREFAIWRNNLPIVKNAYDKAHLFDYIKG